MDVETGVTAGKGDGELVVFTDIVYKLPSSLYDRFKACRHGIDSEHCRKTILNGVCGAFRPAALTFILGPSGAGKSTLLQIIAGRRRAGVSGKVRGAGRGTVLVAQHGALIATLTARETLLFAASLKLSRLNTRAREHAVQEVTTQLGIESCMKTKTSQMSGGECKRLCIATELLTNPAVLLLDEPTSGLDSVSSLSVIRALTSVARGGRTVACVLHQPASRLYAAADDVLLLSDGRTLYSGSRSEAPAALIRAGFECPQYYNPADFLLELTSGEQEGDLNKLEGEARAYAYQLEQTCKSNLPQKNGKVPEAEALLVVDNIAPARKYDASTSIQLRSLLWRCCVGAIRDVHLTQIRVVCHILVAFLLGALYSGAGADAARVTSNTACIFFFLLFLFFSNTMPTIHTFPVEAEVVQQEHLNHWYSLPAYCASKLIADLPVQLVCATMFCVPAWMLTSQPTEAWRLALMWGVCVLLTILAQTLGLVAGAACGVKMGLFAVPAANIPMLMFSDFFITYKEIPSYLKPLSNISYFRYAFDASMQAVYGFDRKPLHCSADFCLFRHPDKYLNMLGLTGDYTKDIYALVIWIFLAQIALVVVLFIKIRVACK